MAKFKSTTARQPNSADPNANPHTTSTTLEPNPPGAMTNQYLGCQSKNLMAQNWSLPLFHASSWSFPQKNTVSVSNWKVIYIKIFSKACLPCLSEQTPEISIIYNHIRGVVRWRISQAQLPVVVPVAKATICNQPAGKSGNERELAVGSFQAKETWDFKSWTSVRRWGKLKTICLKNWNCENFQGIRNHLMLRHHQWY